MYSSGKKAEDINTFVKQKTGFDVRSPLLFVCGGASACSRFAHTVCACVWTMFLQFVVLRSKAFLYALLAAAVVLLAVAAKIILSNLDTLLDKLRRKRLWMTVSLVRECVCCVAGCQACVYMN